MADPSRNPVPGRDDTGGDAGAGPEREPDAGTPRWVKAFAVVAVVLVVLFVVLQVFGGGHGPGRHSGETGERAPLARRL